MYANMQTVLMAAGRGTRLRPLTDRQPKPTLPVAEQPLLAHIADGAVDAGTDRFAIVVGYQADTVRESMGAEHRGVPIEYVQQKEMVGTADAVRVATEALEPGPFAVLNGDVMIPRTGVQELFAEGPSILGANVPDPRNYGVLEVDSTGERVVGVVEKPANPPSTLANAGGYVFPAEAQEYVHEVEKSPRGEYELTDVLARVCDEFSVRPVSVDRWLDVGRPWELLAANEWKLSQVPSGSSGAIAETATVGPNVHIESGAEIREGAIVEGPTLIESDTIVGPNAHIGACSLLGENVTIGTGAHVANSVIYAGTTVDPQATLTHSILARHVRIGAGSCVQTQRHDGEPVRMTIKGESTSTDRASFGAVLGEAAVTGVNSSLGAGVVLGTERRTEPGESLLTDRR